MTITDFTTASEHEHFRQVVRDHYSGEGYIVDAGCYVGASTLSLCEGVSESIFRARLIDGMKSVIAMDRFLAMDEYIIDSLRLSGREIRYGESFLSVFLDRLHAYLPYLDVRAGDLYQVGRIDAPLEILFVDVAKSPGLNTFVIRSWFPHLVPGAIVIQQDFYTPAQPWVAASMGLALDYFDPMGVRVGETMTFRLRKNINVTQLQAIASRAADPVMRVQAFDRLLELDDPLGRYPLLLMKAIALSDLGMKEQGASVLDDAYAAYDALQAQGEIKAVKWFALAESVVRPRNSRMLLQYQGILQRHLPRSRMTAVRLANEDVSS